MIVCEMCPFKGSPKKCYEILGVLREILMASYLVVSEPDATVK